VKAHLFALSHARYGAKPTSMNPEETFYDDKTRIRAALPAIGTAFAIAGGLALDDSSAQAQGAAAADFAAGARQPAVRRHARFRLKAPSE
jgi:hypothetical protein